MDKRTFSKLFADRDFDQKPTEFEQKLLKKHGIAIAYIKDNEILYSTSKDVDPLLKDPISVPMNKGEEKNYCVALFFDERESEYEVEVDPRQDVMATSEIQATIKKKTKKKK